MNNGKQRPNCTVTKIMVPCKNFNDGITLNGSWVSVFGIGLPGSVTNHMATKNSKQHYMETVMTQPKAAATEIFIATMFSGDGHATHNSGLLVATSTDGVRFRNIRDSLEPVFTPEGGMRDPSVLYWQGLWHLVYSYGPNVAPLLFLATSPDLLHWSPAGTVRLAADTVNNYVDVPQWVVDPAGKVHLVACIDDHHHWIELHPMSPDPATWGQQANWSPVTTMTDDQGEPLVQGNSFVALREGRYYMAFNEIESIAYSLRTAERLTSGWSAARPLALDRRVNLVFLADGRMRFYISNGNALRKVMWYIDSANLGVSWTEAKELTFEGFGPTGVNWAQVARVTEPEVLATLLANP